MQSVTAVFVMIASPSDVPEARETAYQALAHWNEGFSASRNIALVPLRWETSAVPQIGAPAQDIINSQLVDQADIVIAIFGSRLGSATQSAISGTAEEINRAHNASKPVHIYFSNAPHPNDVDIEQLALLRQFKADLEGLYGVFDTPAQLHSMLWQAIDHDLRQLEASEGKTDRRVGAVDFLAQPGEEQRPKTDSRGRLRYETIRWIDLTNRGGADALEVEVLADPDDNFFIVWDGPSTVHAGQSRRIPMDFTWGTSNPKIEVRWKEAGTAKSAIFHVG